MSHEWPGKVFHGAMVKNSRLFAGEQNARAMKCKLKVGKIEMRRCSAGQWARANMVLWIAMLILVIGVAGQFIITRMLAFDCLFGAMVLGYVATSIFAVRAYTGNRPNAIEAFLALMAWLGLVASSVLVAVNIPSS